MTIQNLQTQIIDKDLQNFYIFVGEDTAIQKVYIDKIQQIANLPIEYIYSFSDIPDNLGGFNLFNDNKIYILLYIDELINQGLTSCIQKASKDIIIVRFISLDKKSKFFKTFEDNVVFFENPASFIIKNYIKNQIELSDYNITRLIDFCNNDYDKILQELDKIKHCGINDYNNAFEYLLSQNAFYKDSKDVLFKFIDSITYRNIADMRNLYYDAKSEPVLKIILLLYNTFKTILLIQSCKSPDIAKITGLANNQIYYNKDKVGYYTIEELINILKLLQRVEYSIKTGKLEEDYALDYILINIL